MSDQPTAAPDAPAVRIERDGSVLRIVLDNPARMNALTAAMWRAIPAAFAQAASDPEIRAVVLRGSGRRAFCAGADISEFDTARTGDSAKDYDAANHAAFDAVSDCPKPTIAMVHGFCLGGGMGLALACDLRIADKPASFAIPAGKLGIGYNARWIRPLLAIAGPAYAKEVMFTARRFTAREALRMGVVNAVHPADDLEAATGELVQRIADNAPLSLMAAKRAIDELTSRPENPDTAELDRLAQACFDSDDYAEGRAAFAQKRKPVFRRT